MSDDLPFKTPTRRRQQHPHAKDLKDFIDAARRGDYSVVTDSTPLIEYKSPRRSRDLIKEKEELEELRKNILNSREKLPQVGAAADLRVRRHHINQKLSLAIN